MKQLLTFAHRGEAQAFLSASSFKAVDFFFDGLFESESFYLLITGEGPHNASEKTISVLTKLSNEIDEVFNIGVAGSLNHNLKKNALVWVRSAFAHHAERLEFKSYTSPLKEAKNDCITAYTRILSAEERKKLSLFANMVDRELWSVASASQLFKKPFYAVKIISDEAADTSEDICKFVKADALAFSEKLLIEFKTFKKTKIIPNDERKKGEKDSAFLNDPIFYFTTSQERKLLSLIHSLKIKGIELTSLDLSSIKTLEISPKDRSRFLLQFLNDELNPMAKKIRKALTKKLMPLELAAIATSFDPDFEQDWLTISMKIQSSRDLEKIKNALKIFSYEDFKTVLNGGIDGHV